ncbi:tyrosine-protein phosphatase non-receptor type 2-like [Gracilinanus agilis]|uniref:tyrosine-protein phosphatase non-receptor type 2-like n=1 Tax=Gracilinanus agilis TaxID=191870 RepID=UPI001CFD2623|nr:tyrosine-protein phosphatase non-receptor type 2-like [Gracilinanus agilis]
MSTPESPKDMEISECEMSSCSATPNITKTSSSSVVATPTSLVSMASIGTDEDLGEEEEEAMLVSGYGAAVLGTAMHVERELEALDKSNGWPQAYLEVGNQCHDYPYRVARAPENRPRNRYRDVSPYDHSRVRLRAATRNDYINANFVMVEEAQRSYILTQGPLPNTCSHFWLMVWQQDSKAVIMLNRLVEKDSVKCSQYWPPNQGESLLFEEMGISVYMVGEDVGPYHTVRYLNLQNMMTGETRAISHFHYNSWPDFGVPESPASFLSFLFMVRESGCLSYERGPAIIHCSAGIGRSGTFALIDTCLVLMEKKENPFSLNIRKVLVCLRKYRMGLIQTPEQLRFSYVAVIEGAKFLMGDENVKKKWKQLTNEDHARSYSFDTSPPPSGILSKKHKAFRLVLNLDDDDDDDDDDDEIGDESDFSDLATRMPDSGEESSEGGTRKRSLDECKPSTSRDENPKVEEPSKTGFKRKRLNL